MTVQKLPKNQKSGQKDTYQLEESGQFYGGKKGERMRSGKDKKGALNIPVYFFKKYLKTTRQTLTFVKSGS